VFSSSRGGKAGLYNLYTTFWALLHFVFIMKYREPVLRRGRAGGEGFRARDLSDVLDIEILQGHVRPEQVHLLLHVPRHVENPSGAAGSVGAESTQTASRVRNRGQVGACEVACGPPGSHPRP
jgi:REP element-mobilizing transposase RayT